MRCPRCKMNDVYQSRGNKPLLSFLFQSVRCHRCCHLFTVARWKSVPVASSGQRPSAKSPAKRRAA